MEKMYFFSKKGVSPPSVEFRSILQTGAFNYPYFH